MPDTTLHPAIGGSDFRGKTRSFTVLPGGRSWPTCRHCGSTIYPQRFESSKVRSIGGARLTVDKFRCRTTRARAAFCLHDRPPSAQGVHTE